jgi:hypothetical protein
MPIRRNQARQRESERDLAVSCSGGGHRYGGAGRGRQEFPVSLARMSWLLPWLRVLWCERPSVVAGTLRSCGHRDVKTSAIWPRARCHHTAGLAGVVQDFCDEFVLTGIDLACYQSPELPGGRVVRAYQPVIGGWKAACLFPALDSLASRPGRGGCCAGPERRVWAAEMRSPRPVGLRASRHHSRRHRRASLRLAGE